MATVYVNEQPVEIGDDEKLNVIQVAERVGVHVPYYCWHPALTVVASCRMCLVEAGQRQDDGSFKFPGKVVPGCQTPATHNTAIRTDTEKVKFDQARSLEGLLINHPLDCPVCDKAGECHLQDYSYKHGFAHSRMVDEKRTPPNKDYIGENVTLFTDRCILCSRCVRFTREISGEGELEIIHRGHHSEIDIFPDEPLNNKLATNVVDLCPVGALCSKDFLYTQRVWNLKTVDSVCPDCSTGCSINVDQNKNVVYRLHPRANPNAQGHFMCDDGRLGYHYVNSSKRIARPQIKSGNGSTAGWSDILPVLRNEIRETATADASSVMGVFSPFMTCEEAYLLAKYLKGVSGQVRLVLGPVPIVGEDDKYPKDRRGNPTDVVKFIIRAEKAPNRRGVEEVLRQFQGEILNFDEATKAANEDQLKLLYLVGGYPPRDHSWINDDQITAIQKVPTLVIQDLFPSKLSESAKYVLPAATFAEKDGTFVNCRELAQAIHRSVTPHSGLRVDGQRFMDLMERSGLFHGPTIRKEMAEEIPYFGALATHDGKIGELGIRLGEAADQ